MAKDLDGILKEYFGCETAFDENGEFTEQGGASYDKLIMLLYDLAYITGINVEELVRELDEICGE